MEALTEVPTEAPRRKRSYRKSAAPRKPRQVRAVEYVIQQRKAENGGGVSWVDAATGDESPRGGGEVIPFKDTTHCERYLKSLIASEALPETRYRIVAVKRVLDAAVTTEKRVTFG